MELQKLKILIKISFKSTKKREDTLNQEKSPKITKLR